MRPGFAGLVGNTPLVKLHAMSEETGCEILAKVESANGGGSVKDRAALFLVRDAERKGQLKPGKYGHVIAEFYPQTLHHY